MCIRDRTVVAAVEVADPVGAVIRRGQPVGMLAAGPAVAVTRADRQWPELIERETPVKPLVQDLVDPVQLGVLVGIRGFLPGPRPLERRCHAGAAAGATVPAEPERSGPGCPPGSRPASAGSSG